MPEKSRESMKKDEIRLQYSGFVIFAAQMISVITGLVFTLLLTRNMTRQEYGIWANIFDLIGYFLLLSGVFPFWTMRFVARHQQGAAKTGFMANLLVSLIFTFLYVSVAPFLTATFNIGPAYSTMYLIAGAQIVNMYLIVVLESILRSKRPQAIGYGLLIEEVCKIILAYIFIVRLQQLFLGALLSLIIAATVQLLFYLKLAAAELKSKIHWSYAREWLKGSTANLYNAVGNQLAAFTIILLFIYGGQAARGDFQAASTYSAAIGYPLFLAYALYPRLLTKNNPKEVTLTLKTILMFAIPMMTIIISLPQSLLTILNVRYYEATPILLLLAVDTFVVLISQFYSSVLFGVERLDEQATIPFGKLVKSKIFKVFSLPYIQAAIGIPTCFYFLSRYANGNSVLAAVFVIVINLGAHIAMLLIQYSIVRNSVSAAFPWRSTGKYVFASAIAAAFLYFIPDTTTLSLTLAVALAGSVIYASILLAIDEDARKIVAAIFKEVKIIVRRQEPQQET
jgi:O-antigen/teichoic acid export membrane protein